MEALTASFLWGATISAHSTEGEDFHSDWWRWEQRPGRIAGNATSECASAHGQHRLKDYALAKKLGMNTLQVALSWPRIHSAPDSFDEQALAAYVEGFAYLKQQNIKVICILAERSSPQWFQEAGAWAAPQALSHFSRYMQHVIPALSPYCRFFIPVYEPAYYLDRSYGEKEWPASKRGAGCFHRAEKNLLQAHRLCRQVLEEKAPKSVLGLSIALLGLSPESPESPWDLRLTRRERRFHHFRFLEALGESPPHFLALSWQGEHQLRATPWRLQRRFVRTRPALSPQRQDRYALSKSAPRDFSGQVRAMNAVIRDFFPREIPLLITGLGLATEEDEARRLFLLDQLHGLQELERESDLLMGFLYRSLLDGFEWNEGYSARYGLLHVDRKTQTRTPNESAFLYKEIIQKGAIHPDLIKKWRPDWEPFDL